MWNVLRNPFGRFLMLCGLLLGFAATTAVCRADDISTVTDSVSGYVTAAIAVGVAVLLFVLGRKVLRKLVALAFIAGLAGFMSLTAHAQTAPTDIAGVTTAVSGYVTAAIVVGVAVLLFVLGRKVLRKLI